jgi:hypothetical protein
MGNGSHELYCLGRRGLQDGRRNCFEGNATTLSHELQARAHVLGSSINNDEMARNWTSVYYIIKHVDDDSMHSPDMAILLVQGYRMAAEI